MKNRPLCTVCLILSLLICGAVCIGKERAVKELAPSSLECCARDGDEIVFTGQIYKKEIKDDYQILYLKNNSIRNQKQFFTESESVEKVISSVRRKDRDTDRTAGEGKRRGVIFSVRA